MRNLRNLSFFLQIPLVYEHLFVFHHPFLFVIYYKNHDIPKTFPCTFCINIVTLPRKPLKDKAMGTSKPQTCDNAKQQEAANADVVKKDKKPFKLTVVTKEELEQLRIPVYPYIL